METQQGKKKTPKKIWWFKEELDVFESKLVRKLRMKENGDSLFVIYHKLRLLAAKNFGTIKIEDFGESPAEDIAFSIQEKPDNVEIVLDVLQSHGLIDFNEDKTELLFPEVVERICSVSDSKERVRRFRERQKQKQTDSVTCNGESVTEMLQPLQSVTVTTREREDIREHNITEEREEKNFPLPSDEGFIDWAWEKIKSKYPREDGAEAAKPLFVKFIEQVPIEDRDTMAHRLQIAVIMYHSDYDEKNPDDAENHTYVNGFSRWFREDFDKYMGKAAEYQQSKQTEQS